MGRLFSHVYEGVMAPLDALGLRNMRRELLVRAQGLTLEVGAGTGRNLPFYPQRVTAIASDLEPAMLDKALARRHRLGVGVPLLSADAQALPFREATFDTVLATFAFCSMRDPRQGLQEARRVLKPGGLLLLLEHVLVPNRFLALLQEVITPLWKHLTVGCHLNRNPLPWVDQAGFHLRFARRSLMGYFLEIEAVNPEAL